MHPDLDKVKLLELIRIEYEFTERTLALIPEHRLTEPGAQAGSDWSVKDLLAHITSWERRLLGWLAQAKRGEAPSFPAPGITLDQVDELNDSTHEQDKTRSLEDVLADFRSTHQEVMRCIEHFPEEELFELRRLKGVWHEPPLGFIIGNTYDHYLEHTRMIRQWLNSIRDTDEHFAVKRLC